jgi:hypothetical protein
VTGPRPVEVGALTPGDRVVYRLRGRVVAETVTAVAPLPSPAGWVAVRFAGRRTDVHYPIHSCVLAAPAAVPPDG